MLQNMQFTVKKVQCYRINWQKKLQLSSMTFFPGIITIIRFLHLSVERVGMLNPYKCFLCVWFFFLNNLLIYWS